MLINGDEANRKTFDHNRGREEERERDSTYADRALLFKAALVHDNLEMGEPRTRSNGSREMPSGGSEEQYEERQTEHTKYWAYAQEQLPDMLCRLRDLTGEIF